MDNSTLKHIERAISITADIDDFIGNIFDEDDTIVDGMPNERHNNQPHHRMSRSKFKYTHEPLFRFFTLFDTYYILLGE
ncbi:unnamed protein product [Rhizophagus irregularis]|nr:unnamed protein product [Rhizophagus irregularis]